MYNFASLARTLIAFVDALRLTSYALYLFNFGAAVGYRLALAHPERVTAIVAQGGNAYIEGLGKAWEPVRILWDDLEAQKKEPVHEYTYKKASRTAIFPHRGRHSEEEPTPIPTNTGPSEDKLRLLRAAVLSPEGVHWVYSHGSGASGNRRTVAPESHMFESALLLQEPERGDVHLALLADYRSTVRMYPLFQQYFREWAPRMLVIWGTRDVYLDPRGAGMYRRDIPDAEIMILDAGHFALETHVEEIAAAVTRHVLML